MEQNHAPADAGDVAVRADRARVAQIDEALRRAAHMLPATDAAVIRAEAVEAGHSAQQVRESIFERLEAAQPIILQGHTGGATFDNPAFLRSAMAEALSCRAGAGQPSGPAREFMTLRMVDMAGKLLEAGGVSTRGLTPTQILTRAFHTTSDFPALLQNTGDRVLMQAFEPAASGLRRLVRMRMANDFRALSTIRFAGVDRLLEVGEGGEVKHGTAFEAAESYRVKSFARSVSITRQALINDDLGAFDAMRAIGRAAAVTEAEELVTLLTANSGAGPTMADGQALFRTQRNNMASAGGAIDVANVSTGRAAMRSLQADLNGVTIANTPRLLLVGPARETAAEQFVASITPATSGAVNPFAGRLEVVVEPRLSGNAWYLFADPAEAAMFEMATLSATGGAPQIEVFTDPTVLGVTVRVVHDFGVGAVSPIGGWRNPGA